MKTWIIVLAALASLHLNACAGTQIALSTSYDSATYHTKKPPYSHKIKHGKQPSRSSASRLPTFADGKITLTEYIQARVQFPEMAQYYRLQGRVVVQFTVKSTGKPAEFKVIEGRVILDRQVIRVLRKMPKWKPGMQAGRPVKVKFRVPVYFNN